MGPTAAPSAGGRCGRARARRAAQTPQQGQGGQQADNDPEKKCQQQPDPQGQCPGGKSQQGDADLAGIVLGDPESAEKTQHQQDAIKHCFNQRYLLATGKQSPGPAEKGGAASPGWGELPGDHPARGQKSPANRAPKKTARKIPCRWW